MLGQILFFPANLNPNSTNSKVAFMKYFFTTFSVTILGLTKYLIINIVTFSGPYIHSSSCRSTEATSVCDTQTQQTSPSLTLLFFALHSTLFSACEYDYFWVRLQRLLLICTLFVWVPLTSRSLGPLCLTLWMIMRRQLDVQWSHLLSSSAAAISEVRCR